MHSREWVVVCACWNVSDRSKNKRDVDLHWGVAPPGPPRRLESSVACPDSWSAMNSMRNLSLEVKPAAVNSSSEKMARM
jgi:hypothetical protein